MTNLQEKTEFPSTVVPSQPRRQLRSQPVLHCDVCDSPGNILYGSLEDPRGVTTGRYAFRRCNNYKCGTLWLDPRPIVEDIHLAYQEYYTHVEHGAAPAGTLLRPFRKAIVELLGISRAQAQQDRMFLDDERRGSLLDIGCGNGRRLKLLSDLGWSVHGQDVDAKAATVARAASGAQVFVGPLQEAHFDSDSFDVIISNHVFEHLHDPASLLAEAYRLLKAGGVLVFVMPNGRSRLLEHYGGNWIGLDPPRHLRIFTSDALKILAERVGIPNVKTWTTASQAELYAGDSYDCAYRRKHDGVGPSRLRRLGDGTYWGMRGWFGMRSDPDSGEELILWVRKPAV